MVKGPKRSSKIINVFISYSRHEHQVDRVKAIAEWLSQLSEKRVRFITDLSLIPGDDIFDFERSIKFFKFCIIIGTPEYKRKSEIDGHGVHREFQLLSKRYAENSIKIIPVIIDSTFTESFPLSGGNPLAVDMSGIMHDFSDKIISKPTMLRFSNQAQIIIDRILETNQEEGIPYTAKIEDIRKKLFFEPKHEELNPHLADTDMDKVFVKTSFYYAVRDEHAYLLIGRKGSGKSFLTEYFIRNSSESDTLAINIHLRNFRLSNIFQMRSIAKISHDIGDLIDQRSLFECIWYLFYVLSSMIRIYIEIRKDHLNFDMGNVRAIERVIDPLDLNFYEYDAVSESHAIHFQVLMDWCSEKIFHNVNGAISGLSNDYARAVAQIPSFVDPVKSVIAILGRPAINAYRNIVLNTRSRFLFTLDGFDTKFDSFRRDTIDSSYSSEQKIQRVKFEIDWLAGLVEATGRVLSQAPPSFPTMIHPNTYIFIITLPRDRFIEFRKSDRDAYRTRHRFVEIRWSGPELMNLIRKRLEIYIGTKSNSKDMRDQFREVMTGMKNIPLDIEFDFGRERVSISLFNYILRHTFWRPRDVLYYVAEMIRLSERFERRNQNITVEKIRQRINEITDEVIDTEFYGEFLSIFPLIREFTAKFRRHAIEMSYQELYEVIGGNQIRLSSGESIVDFEGKIDFLYEIGFLGVVPTQDDRKRLGFFRREAFSFSDSLDIYRRMDSENKIRSRWVVHPIFVKELQLSTENCDFLLKYDEAFINYGDG